MAEIYVKSKAYDGHAYCVVAVQPEKKSIQFHNYSFEDCIRVRGDRIPIDGVEANIQMELWAVIYGVTKAGKDDELLIYTHYPCVAEWINGSSNAEPVITVGKVPTKYDKLLRILISHVIGKKVHAWQIDFGKNRVMNALLDKLINLEKLKKYA